VTAGHCCTLAFIDDASAGKIIEQVAAAGLNVVTLPSCNLVLMGRGMQPPPRGVTRVKELLAAGVNVCAGSDNAQDPFNPFGSYDPLQSANFAAHTAHLTGASELAACGEMVTTCAAHTFGLKNYGLSVGAPADLVVLDAFDVQDAVTAPPPRLATFKGGRLIVRTHTEREWNWFCAILNCTTGRGWTSPSTADASRPSSLTCRSRVPTKSTRADGRQSPPLQWPVARL